MDKIIVKVICFAGLRKYFGSETTILVERGATYAKVVEELTSLHPEAKEVLTSCRIAVNEEFISPDETLKSAEIIFLIPPSSGG